MHNSKKAIIVSISFLCVLILLSGIVLYPSLYTETQSYMDSDLRESLAGELDTLVVGSSHCLAGVMPQVLDSELGCRSYNLSNTMMTIQGRKAMLEKELGRNPVDTVILELSFNAMTRDETEDGANGDAITLARLDTSGERLAFLRQCGALHNFTSFYSKMLVQGVSAWSSIYETRSLHNVDYSLKGFHPTNAVGQTFTEDEIQNEYQSGLLFTNNRSESVEAFQEIVDLCRSYDVNVAVVVLPVSDNILWQLSDWDTFRNWAETFCKDNNCDFYDMNLLKNRNELFSIEYSFSDDIHLSAEGANACTRQLAEILKLREDGEDVSDLFFDNYVEAIDNLPYNLYLNR